MDEVDRFGEVLEGYADCINELLAAWTPFLTGLSTKLAAGPYGPNEAAADFPAAAKLAVDSMIAIGSEAFDAVSILTLGFDETETVGGLMFAKSPVVRTLTVKADFVSVTGENLPKERITIVPDHLAPGETRFGLQVDGDGLKARTYDGWIVATDTAGVVAEAKETVTIG